MKVKYTGQAQSLTNGAVYEVLDGQFNWCNEYKVRNDCGKVEWYAKSKFAPVIDRNVSYINNHLVNKIERELKETEERMAALRKELENAKNPPTNNILLRQTRQSRAWIEEISETLCDLTDAIAAAVPELKKNLCLFISSKGDGIILDDDYRWEIRQDGNKQVLVILDK